MTTSADADITLDEMTAEAADELAGRIAEIDPWRRLAIPADRIRRLLEAGHGLEIRAIQIANRPVGAIVVQCDWLLGPYLQHLSVLPEAQARGAGTRALAWLEGIARRDGQSNIWLCVSAFNSQALAFYARHGFVEAANLPDLVRPGEDEILMRRRLEA
jgi:ribosomal protein S18 acetylase RimI-like enzyme